MEGAKRTIRQHGCEEAVYPAVGSSEMLSVSRTTWRQVAGAHLISSVTKCVGTRITFCIQRCKYLLRSSLRAK